MGRTSFKGEVERATVDIRTRTWVDRERRVKGMTERSRGITQTLIEMRERGL
jgi:hypothetical protein